MYQVVKRYGHEEGWSCAFRQWPSDSHCRFIHGYAFAFEFTFESADLDHCNWCLDFGSLKGLKEWLKSVFDHKTLIAANDPHAAWFWEAHRRGLIDLLELPQVSCEMFAHMAFEYADRQLRLSPEHPRVRLVSVKISEHSGNSAIYYPDSQ
jgi:6-pyruvoyltetrahydropterin/6-carboxytetrahydropterin synthase